MASVEFSPHEIILDPKFILNIGLFGSEMTFIELCSQIQIV